MKANRTGAGPPRGVLCWSSLDSVSVGPAQPGLPRGHSPPRRDEGPIPGLPRPHPLLPVSLQEPDRQYMHIGTMVEFAFALVAKLDAINKHSFNDFKLRVGKLLSSGLGGGEGLASGASSQKG